LQLTDEAFLEAPFPVPADTEQAAIVCFLDHVDGRIRRYIHAKQSLIGLLQEWQRAVIYRAITRGSSPHSSLVPSGLEWLGDIPDNWKVRRIGQLAAVFNGSTPSRANYAYWQDGTIP
jgi:type I restriction enzyme S subunit